MNKQAKIWLSLIIGPLVVIILFSILQTIFNFIFDSNVQDQGILKIVRLVLNIVTWTLFLASLLLLIFLPLWIILLIIALSKSSSNKTTAILLAVFFGALAWLYTYKTDSAKFWINNIVSVLTFGLWGIIAWAWAIIDYSVRPNEFYINYSNKYLNKQLTI